MKARIILGAFVLAACADGCASADEPGQPGSGGSAPSAGRGGSNGQAGAQGGTISGSGGTAGRGGSDSIGGTGQGGSAGASGADGGAAGVGSCDPATLWRVDESRWCVDYSTTIMVESCPPPGTGCVTITACVRRLSDDATFIVGEPACFLAGVDGWEWCRDDPEENELLDECSSGGAGAEGGAGGAPR